MGMSNLLPVSRGKQFLMPNSDKKSLLQASKAVNDDILATCDGYRYIDGVQGSYDVGFNFLEDGTYEIVHFLDIDGIQVWPDIFERDYLERKLIRSLLDEAIYEAELDRS